LLNRHRAALPTLWAVTAATALLAPATAHADPCPQLNCGAHRDGSGGGGGGDSGGGGGTGPGEIPMIPGVGQGGTPVVPGNPTLQHVPTATVAEDARGRAVLPAPVIHTSPEGKSYVRVRTGLWIEPGAFEPRTASASVSDQTVQATATPQNVTWKLVEGSVVCDGPGSKDKAECGYTYQRSSTHQPGGKYRISATITWSVHWTCEGNCDDDEGDAAPMTMTSTFDLTVGEIQTGSRQGT
jgi:hypothetical protein